MVIEFLKNMRSKAMEQKLELETEYNKMMIKLNENEKQMIRLREEEKQNFDAFSPRKQKSNLKATIDSLEKENDQFSEQSEELKCQIEKLDAKIIEVTSVLKDLKENYTENKDMTPHSKGKKRYMKLQEAYQEELLELIHKIEFCSTLIDLDPVRCKIELSALLKILYDKTEVRKEMERKEMRKEEA